NPAPGTGGTSAGDTENPVAREARWLTLWAYATSPHGLGLTDSAFWALSYREFDALRTVARQPIERWAMEQAMFANAHFRGKDDPPWVAADFLEPNHREKTKAEATASKLAVLRANRILNQMKPGDKVDDLPPWARG